MQTEKNNGWMFCGEVSKGLGGLRDITYSNLVDHLYDLLGVDKQRSRCVKRYHI